jgi:hypothetical protein
MTMDRNAIRSCNCAISLPASAISNGDSGGFGGDEDEDEDADTGDVLPFDFLDVFDREGVLGLSLLRDDISSFSSSIWREVCLASK